MLGFDTIQEIFASLKQNRLRTTLTGLSIAWGIFILIVLLGAGHGLKNGVTSNFSSRSTNTVQMWPGRATLPYKGLKADRGLAFTEKELDVLSEHVPEAGKQTGLISSNRIVTYASESNSYEIIGVQPAYADIFNLEFESGGRFINDHDLQMNNKVIVLDKRIEEVLFKGKPALGQYVKVASVMFRVIGVNSRKNRWGEGSAYIPFTTAQVIFNPNKKFYSIAFEVHGLESEKANQEFNDRLKGQMASSMSFDAKDPRALWIRNSQENYLQAMKIFGAINIFLFIIGVLTLLAGVVGISNIMLVSVKERTREFGIRKALGAPPASILLTVVVESIVITTIFGYLGMLAGIGLTELVAAVMEGTNSQSDTGMSIFKNPTVDMSYVFIATGILIVSGIVAGYMPARKAVRIKPIEAMQEK